MLLEKKPFVTDYVEMWIEKGIVHTAYPTNLVLTLELAKQIVKDRISYCEGNTYKGLADIRNLKKAEVLAMKYFASEESFACLSKLAVYSDKRWSKIFANFWFKVDKPYKPTKYFTDKGSAYIYLMEIHEN
ncbi:MAG: hypothetical protein GQ574_25675 [Crocinitomix sp.]|nr:hypothetical protein [Crocinitomix sp.]